MANPVDDRDADTKSNTASNSVDDALFWEVAEEFLALGAERSTMMGFPCLRIDGDFFTSVDRHSGDLIVKLPADRVTALIDDRVAQPFAPNGRRFKEWASVPGRDGELWSDLMHEALAFVRG